MNVLDPELQAEVDAVLNGFDPARPHPFARNPMGIGMVGPTLAHHGTDTQRAHAQRPGRARAGASPGTTMTTPPRGTT